MADNGSGDGKPWVRISVAVIAFLGVVVTALSPLLLELIKKGTIPLPSPTLTPSSTPIPSAIVPPTPAQFPLPTPSAPILVTPSPSLPAPLPQQLKSECLFSGRFVKSPTRMVPAGNKTERVKSQFFVSEGKPYSITCKILNNSGELPLRYVIPSNSSLIRVSIKIYLDGNSYKTFTLDRGEVLRENIDISSALDYKLEFSLTMKQNGVFTPGSIYVLDEDEM
jgi:hypothetical protein